MWVASPFPEADSGIAVALVSRGGERLGRKAQTLSAVALEHDLQRAINGSLRRRVVVGPRRRRDGGSTQTGGPTRAKWRLLARRLLTTVDGPFGVDTPAYTVVARSRIRVASSDGEERA